MPHLLIIGGPSIDILHFKNQTKKSAGGAGLYTALAAYRSGCDITMYSPKPDPIPDLLNPLEERLTEWFGPIVTLNEIRTLRFHSTATKQPTWNLMSVKKNDWILQHYHRIYQFMMAYISPPWVIPPGSSHSWRFAAHAVLK